MAFSGVWQFGYTFYLYNTLESAVRDGARYASLATYDAPDGTNWSTRAKEMVVYGDPNPPSGSRPVVPGLTTSKITVTAQKDTKGVPHRLTVQVDGFTINGLFAPYTLNAKPRCRFDYMGRYSVP